MNIQTAATTWSFAQFICLQGTIQFWIFTVTESKMMRFHNNFCSFLLQFLYVETIVLSVITDCLIIIKKKSTMKGAFCQTHMQKFT